MKIAIIGDSISTRNNGCASHSWPELLSSMISSMGVFDIEVHNYSIPGLTWKTSHVETSGWLIGNTLSPLECVKRDGCDILLICMGVNDRNNSTAMQDARIFQAAWPDCRVIMVRQSMYDGNGTNDSIVTLPEQNAMDAVYASLGGEGFSLGLGKLYDMGYSYDMLHPTDSGKQWIASAVYMYLQQSLPITPINRNIAWLYSQSDLVKQQMKAAQT